MEISVLKTSTVHFFEDTGAKVRRSLGRVFSTLTAIQKDNNASVQLLKIGRYAIFVFRAYHGKTCDASLLHRDIDAAINLLEGLQFIAAISSILPTKENKKSVEEESKKPLLERITDIGFNISDCASGVLWFLSKGIRVLGRFSGNGKVVDFLDILSTGAALIASLADGRSATKMIAKHWNVSVPNKTAAIWRLCERVAGVASMALILSGAGGVVASAAAALAIVSAFCGLVRFACDQDFPEEIKQT